MKENSGYLARNDKAKTDRHPSHRGKINVGGQQYWLAAWIRDGDSGKYFSLKIDPVEERRTDGPERQERSDSTGGVDALEDDVPF